MDNMPENSNRLYRGFIWSFTLPYRIYLDDGVYEFRYKETNWILILKAIPRTLIDQTGELSIRTHPSAQFFADSGGLGGKTEIKACFQFIQPKSLSTIQSEGLNSGDFNMVQVDYYFMLEVINRLIALYRIKTNEFWAFSITPFDLELYQEHLWPSDSNIMEQYSIGLSRQMTTTECYLKTEDWYRDLFSRLNSDWEVPLFLELILEGESAMCRSNYRLAYAHFALAVESLFKTLVNGVFPGEKDDEASVKELLGYFFQEYERQQKKPPLPFKKSDAYRYVRTIWKHRNKVMHGHNIKVERSDALASRNAIRALLELWPNMPSIGPPPLLAGPYSGKKFGPITEAAFQFTADEWTERAQSRYDGGHFEEARYAANIAIQLEPHNIHANRVIQEIEQQMGKPDD